MSGIARLGDYASTHTKDDTHAAPGATAYANASSTVFIGGKGVVTVGDSTACGDVVKEGSSSVFVDGKAVHRLGDAMDSHGNTYSPSVCEKASSDVFAG